MSWTMSNGVVREKNSAPIFSTGQLLCSFSSVYLCTFSASSILLDALTELPFLLYALDHTNYARWIPVHLRDMAELSSEHPEVAKEFKEGNFIIRKTNRIFSAIVIHHAHERTMLSSREMEGLLDILKTQVLCPTIPVLA